MLLFFYIDKQNYILMKDFGVDVTIELQKGVRKYSGNPYLETDFSFYKLR